MRRPAAFAAFVALTAAAPAPPPPQPEESSSPPIPATTADAVEVAAQTYVVKPGDTLNRIVARTGAGADAIVRANRLDPPTAIRIGQRLRIPAGRYHLVRKGERGIAIARAYGVDWGRIADLNHLVEPFGLRAGDRLLLPSAREVSAMSMEERARAFRIDIDDLVSGSEPALAPKAKPVAPKRSPARAVPATVAIAPPPEQSFTGRFVWPVVGTVLRRFGPQPNGARNEGVNIRVAMGDTVRAAADGVVAYAGDLAAFGKLVLIRHGGGWLTAYGHADRLLVTRGQEVRQGQPIARAGASGSAREPQLHFEIRDGRRPIDPLSLLGRRE